ncbi:uncharacterized protein TNCT_339071 [Trichonephila clavata]|uniref:Uncharacterized protein n=1 Tax=Trichonephila clavata TaxID=2740835 RepID=A0A8X6FVU9_TRICU|nr:uncharacterized protein TNCT_339071 [Trichonephila clavata]
MKSLLKERIEFATFFALELSFSLCDDGSCVKNKTEEQIPLQVKLPKDSEKHDILLENKEVPEKAEEETSEKQDNMVLKKIL